MSGYLLDTCVVRRWYARDPNVELRMSLLAGNVPLFISAITIGEIEFGHSSPDATDLRKQAHFRRWIRETFEIPQLPVTEATAQEYAKFRRRLFDKFDKKGKFTENREDKLGQKVHVDENDLWLVAQACERNLSFITQDNMIRIQEVVDSDVDITVWPDTSGSTDSDT